MKKLIEAVLFRFGYVPIGQVYAAADAVDEELRRVRAEKSHDVFVAEVALARAEGAARGAVAASTRGLNAELAAITARIPAVTR